MTSDGGTTSTGGKSSGGGAMTGSGGTPANDGLDAGSDSGNETSSGGVSTGGTPSGNGGAGSGGAPTCGGKDQKCCPGQMCGASLACMEKADASVATCSCGESGNKCCAGSGAGTPTCNSNATCAGNKCSCVAEVAADNYVSTAVIVRHVDGTVWQFNSTAGSVFSKVTFGTTPSVATALALSQKTGSSPTIGCAVVDGFVWCFPSSTLLDSTSLGAGLGSSDTTSAAVQVVTAVGGAPLGAVRQIAGGGSLAGQNFCAVTGDGSVWCWGYGLDGELGRGAAANQNFARQVLQDASTPFANAAEVTMGATATCARRTDGSVWCWGKNDTGELGVAPTTTPQSYYPVQIALPGTGEQKLATRLISRPTTTFCVVTADTGVACWGDNASGAAGAAASTYALPTTLLAKSGGPSLTGALELSSGGGEKTCAKTATLDVICWGYNSNSRSPFPSPLVDSNMLAVGGLRLPIVGSASGLSSAGVSYVDSSGRVFVGTTPLPVQPLCP